MSNFFSRFFKKKTTKPKPKQRPVRTYTDTSSLAGIERASRTSKPTFLGDLQMGLGLKKKDTSYKIRTIQTIERNKKKKKKEEEKRKQDSEQRAADRDRAKADGKSQKAKEAAKEPEKTDEELYAQMKAFELQERRDIGRRARRKYERRVGAETAKRRKKIQLLLL